MIRYTSAEVIRNLDLMAKSTSHQAMLYPTDSDTGRAALIAGAAWSAVKSTKTNS